MTARTTDLTALPAITIRRPWAELVATGIKPIENRSWNTNHRGPILIHAGKGWDATAWAYAADRGAWHISDKPSQHPTGIIGVANLTRICDQSTLNTRATLNDSCCGHWATPGQHHWHLTNARTFPKPIPCPGRQGLWYPPRELYPTIAAQFAEVNHA